MKALVALGAGVTGLTYAALAVLVPWDKAEGLQSVKPTLIAILVLSVLVYFFAVWLVSRVTLTRRAVWVVLIVAAAIRLPVLLTPPILSSDVYRYVWDGRVQDAGINPYQYIPADPALAELRDTAIYPHINRADYAHTIYPPAAQIIFAGIARVSQTVFAEKAAMAGFEAVAIFCGVGLLALARLPPERVLIYAWNPLAVWSFACDGHIDAAGVGLLAIALLLRCRGRIGAAGAFFGAAVLVKFLPLAVGPALWRHAGGWRLVVAGCVTIAALYACYAGVGWRVLGFLPGYRAEEGLDNGSGIWLLAALHWFLPVPAAAATVYGIAVVLAMGSYALWIMTRRDSPIGTPADVTAVCSRAALLATFATVAISPHYPWYFAWLALPAIVAPYRAVVWLSAAPVVLWLNPFDNQFVWPSLVYAPAILLALTEFRRPLVPVASSFLEGIR